MWGGGILSVIFTNCTVLPVKHGHLYIEFYIGHTFMSLHHWAVDEKLKNVPDVMIKTCFG
jgi:hypothetical protein